MGSLSSKACACQRAKHVFVMQLVGQSPAIQFQCHCWCFYSLHQYADVACYVLQLFVKAGAGSNGVGRPSGGVILDKVLPCAMMAPALPHAGMFASLQRDRPWFIYVNSC